VQSFIVKLGSLFNRQEKFQIGAILGLMAIAALLETFTVGIIPAFVALLGNPGLIQSNPTLNWLYQMGGFSSSNSFLLWSSLALIGIYIAKSTYLAALSFGQYRFLYSKLIATTTRLFAAYVHKPYTFHLQRNTAQLIRNVSFDVEQMFVGVLLPCMSMASELMVITLIALLLILIEPITATIAALFLGIAMAIFMQYIRRSLNYQGKQRQHYHGQMIQWINQGLGGIKEVKVLGREDFFVDAFEQNCEIAGRSKQWLGLSSQLPNLFIETIVIVSVLAMVAIILAQGKSSQSVLPTLSLFAIAALRLMPSVKRIMSYSNSIRFYRAALDTVYRDLVELNQSPAISLTAGSLAVSGLGKTKASQSKPNGQESKQAVAIAPNLSPWLDRPEAQEALEPQNHHHQANAHDNNLSQPQATDPVPDAPPKVLQTADRLTFNHQIAIRNITYKYPNANQQAIENVSLAIPKATSIALVGSSGAGKTTLADLILGLLVPDRGQILVDGHNIHATQTALDDWQRLIGYIPQQIYLSDDTICHNIAFGLSETQIDRDRVWKSVMAAQLDQLINQLPDRLETIVGERGIRLSGGQKQRVGIARALYHNPEILIMDEATAALDNITETEFVKALESLSDQKTVIMIAHRLSTVKNCDRLYFLQNGGILAAGDYTELLGTCPEFREMVNSNALA
jgi:ABC-type multidrug transport system fused ATPase/permease subunit